jgi:hypothetical protein
VTDLMNNGTSDIDGTKTVTMMAKYIDEKHSHL